MTLTMEKLDLLKQLNKKNCQSRKQSSPANGEELCFPDQSGTHPEEGPGGCRQQIRSGIDHV